MARPKGKLFALLAVFAAIGLVAASGAFTTVEADRTADVSTSGDASALLQLEPHSGPNGQGAYATTSSNQLELNLAGVDGDGVNLDADTDIDNVFNVTNQGTQEVTLYIEKSGTNSSLVTFYNGTVDSGTPIGTDDTSSVTLEVGETASVSMNIDTTDESLGSSAEILNEITIVANEA